MGQRAYCHQDHPGGDAEADRWCEEYHWVTLPKSEDAAYVAARNRFYEEEAQYHEQCRLDQQRAVYEEEYLPECQAEGVEPLNFDDWDAAEIERMVAQAEARAEGR